MVLTFKNIPSHIQKEIVEKMDFKDYLRFEESSKLARKVGKVSNVTLDVKMNCLFLPDLIFGNSLWETLKNRAYCPRLCVKRVFIYPNSTNEMFSEVIREKRITGKNAFLHLNVEEKILDMDLFNQFLQVLNVTTFHHTYSFDPIYIRQPQFRLIEEVNITAPFAIEDLVALKSPKMNVITNSTRITSALNLFFKEWFSNQRKITSFYLYKDKTTIWDGIDHQELFFELPFSCKDLEAGKCLPQYFSLDKGTTKLYIDIYEFEVFAEELTCC